MAWPVCRFFHRNEEVNEGVTIGAWFGMIDVVLDVVDRIEDDICFEEFLNEDEYGKNRFYQ